MSRSVTIIGGGIAGLAAAWSAAQRGDHVNLVDGGPGASALTSGAVDEEPWDSLLAASMRLDEPIRARALSEEVLSFSRALGLWHLAPADEPMALVVTGAGIARPARGHDRSVLDLGRLPEGGAVVLPRVDRGGWDADSLARTLGSDPRARERGLTFAAMTMNALRFADEWRIGDVDLAARHDDEARRQWLGEQLTQALRGARGKHRKVDAFLLGPWLGAATPQAEDLSARVGLPVGEILSPVGGPAGIRFVAARDALLAQCNIKPIRGRALELQSDHGRVVVRVEPGGQLIAADRTLLAIGGLVGGGVVYGPAYRHEDSAVPARPPVPFRLSLAADVRLATSESTGVAWTGPAPRRLGVVGSRHGPDIDATSWPQGDELGALESVGIACDGVWAAPSITVAGDARAGRPRTMLEAVISGLAAASAAVS